MGSFDYSDGVSVAELVVYIPAFFISGFLVFRQGFMTNCGYLFLTAFALLRIIGHVCNLITLEKTSKDLTIAYMICTAIGITPLMLACSGQLSRANNGIRQRTGKGFHYIHFFLFRMLNIVAVALSIYGLTKNMTIEAMENPPAICKVSMAIYLLAWVILMIMLYILWTRRDGLDPGDGRCLLAVAICSPILLIRTIYAVLIFFVNNKTFGLVDANETVEVLMSVIEEIGITVVLIAIGLTLQSRKDGYTKPEDETDMIPKYEQTAYEPAGTQYQQPQYQQPQWQQPTQYQNQNQNTRYEPTRYEQAQF
ncbi:hypothetical protein N7528_008313 [Penicillium herquei]|nr:hypothetical protein N7528_008313 [Penicillium herquei]